MVYKSLPVLNFVKYPLPPEEFSQDIYWFMSDYQTSDNMYWA